MSADMSLNLCGVKLKNPVIAASGTFGFGGEASEFYDISRLGAIAVKGLTLEPRQGNAPPRIAETPSGVLNSVGLQNPGIRQFIDKILPWLLKKDLPVIANIAGNTVKEYAYMAQLLADTGVHFLELNISCPNVKQGGIAFGTQPEAAARVTGAVKAVCRQPLIVKLSPNVTDITQIAVAVENAGADAVSLINTITGMAIDAHTRKPVLANITGGLSGPAVKPVALRMVWQVYNAVKIPVIGMGGIIKGTDVAEFMLAGADAVMVGTANMTEPAACVRILEELEQYMDTNKIKSPKELKGALIV